MTPPIATSTPLGTPSAPPTGSEIRIYVACLAAYNSGYLHGRWIDATLGVDHIWSEVCAMLAASPMEDAEEWAIHDFEGFAGLPISEYAGFDTVAELAAFIAEYDALGGKLIAHFCGNLDEARAALEDYAGEYSSLAAFAAELHEQTGTEIPASFQYYINWDDMGRDMALNGDVFTIELGFEHIHIFWSR